MNPDPMSRSRRSGSDLWTSSCNGSEIWGGDDHWHAQTHYLAAGRRIGVTQAGVGGLPPGRLVRVRGEYGIRSQGVLYWIEREFVVAFSPGEKELALKLEWATTGK